MNDKPTGPQTSLSDDRRAFLNRVGKAAVTAPAAALLLAASSRPSAAQVVPTSGNREVGDSTQASDIRLKEDIVHVGTTAHGLPLYHFRYIGQPAIYEGVMAQDVLGVMPEAVETAEDGTMRVKYGMLGVEFRRVH